MSFINAFSKCNIGWPRQPQTERVTKFNLIFHDSTYNYFFKHQNKAIFIIKLLNLRTWLTEELSSDFSGLRYLCSLTNLGSLRNLNGLNNLQHLFFLSKLPDLDDLMPPGTNISNTDPFL